jgi:hypothetical protein
LKNPRSQYPFIHSKQKKVMIKYITTALILLTAAIGTAQNTDLLGIYNTGSRFTLTRADFGAQTATQLVADMVFAHDTVKVISTVADSSRSKSKHSYENRCNILSELTTNKDYYKGKIVLMELNKACDVTQTCLLAQKAGAKAFVFIHNSNSNGYIKLPKKGEFKDSINIPVFVVGKEKGKDISALIPSVAGIRQNSLAQSLVKQDSVNTVGFLSEQPTGKQIVQQASLHQSETVDNNVSGQLNTLETGNPFDISKPFMKLSPNPTKDVAYINYGVPQPTDVQMDVKNAAGQVIFTQILRGVQTGTVSLNTQNWANNVYIVEMRFGKEVLRQKLVVQR